MNLPTVITYNRIVVGMQKRVSSQWKANEEVEKKNTYTRHTPILKNKMFTIRVQITNTNDANIIKRHPFIKRTHTIPDVRIAFSVLLSKI